MKNNKLRSVTSFMFIMMTKKHDWQPNGTYIGLAKIAKKVILAEDLTYFYSARQVAHQYIR
jgi:hypothetical protein